MHTIYFKMKVSIKAKLAINHQWFSVFFISDLSSFSIGIAMCPFQSESIEDPGGWVVFSSNLRLFHSCQCSFALLSPDNIFLLWQKIYKFCIAASEQWIIILLKKRLNKNSKKPFSAECKQIRFAYVYCECIYVLFSLELEAVWDELFLNVCTGSTCLQRVATQHWCCPGETALLFQWRSADTWQAPGRHKALCLERLLPSMPT